MTTNSRSSILLLLATTGIIFAGIAGCSSEDPAGNGTPGEHVFVANEGGSSVSRVDLTTGNATAMTLGINPHNVQASSDGRSLFVVGTTSDPGHAGHDQPGMLVILDATAQNAQGAAEVEIGMHPAHVVVDADAKRAYATNSEDNTVSVVDIASKTVVTNIPTAAYPHGLRISPDGRELYVACVEDNSVSVIDIASASEVARIPVGAAPVQVAFTPDGKRVYVSLRDQNSIATIDRATRRVIDTIAVGRNPIQLYATPDSRFLYVANQGSEAEPDSTVSVIDIGTNRVTATIPVEHGAHGVVVGGDGAHAYVANTFSNSVTEIDVATQKVMRTFHVGTRPNGITFCTH